MSTELSHPSSDGSIQSSRVVLKAISHELASSVLALRLLVMNAATSIPDSSLVDRLMALLDQQAALSRKLGQWTAGALPDTPPEASNA